MPRKHAPGLCPECRRARAVETAERRGEPVHGKLTRTPHWLRQRVSAPSKKCRYVTVEPGQHPSHRVVVCYPKSGRGSWPHPDSPRVQAVLHPPSELGRLEAAGLTVVKERHG